MKIQFVTPADTAGYVRAHVEISETEALVLKYREKEYDEKRALADAEAHLDARAKSIADAAAKTALESTLSYKLGKLTDEFGAAAVKTAATAMKGVA